MTRGRRLRRGILALVAVLALASPWMLGASIGALGGAWSRKPFAPEAWSPTCSALVDGALAGLDSARAFDFHVHLLGLGSGASGASVNPRLRSWRHPIDHARFLIYLDAAGVDDLARADRDYVERFADLVRTSPVGGRYLMLPFDWRWSPGGRIDAPHSEFHVPNDYAFAIAEKSAAFEPALSVHPYRSDALAELEAGAARGAWIVKWLPNAMGIDPADARCFAFYERMAELGLVLLSHAGVERAVHASEDQELGNPLRLRAALDRGVRVVVAHCASLGEGRDLDAPGEPARPSFELFLRLMDDGRYAGLVWGEISGVTQINRFQTVLATLLEREDLHARLVNGSDYPLPAVNVLFSTRALARGGFLSASERDALGELYRSHPLLFDLVLKRTVSHPHSGARFPASVFELPPALAAR